MRCDDYPLETGSILLGKQCLASSRMRRADASTRRRDQLWEEVSNAIPSPLQHHGFWASVGRAPPFFFSRGFQDHHAAVSASCMVLQLHRACDGFATVFTYLRLQIDSAELEIERLMEGSKAIIGEHGDNTVWLIFIRWPKGQLGL